MVDSSAMFGASADTVTGVSAVPDVTASDADRAFGVDGKFPGSTISFFFNKSRSSLFSLVTVPSLVFRSSFS